MASNKQKFQSAGIIMGKTVNKATGEWAKDGKTYPARPKSYELGVVVGILEESGLFDGTPVTIPVIVTAVDYKRVTAPITTNCVILRNGDRYTIQKMDGFEIVESVDLQKKTDDDDDEDDDE